MCILFHLRMDQVLNTDDLFGVFFCKKCRSGKPALFFSIQLSLSQKVGLDPTNIKDTSILSNSSRPPSFKGDIRQCNYRLSSLVGYLFFPLTRIDPLRIETPAAEGSRGSAWHFSQRGELFKKSGFNSFITICFIIVISFWCALKLAKPNNSSKMIESRS